MKSFLRIIILEVLVFSGIFADIPCAQRQIPNQSVVCVCNETYCDEITRDSPVDNEFVVYTSSEGGLRFNKSKGLWDYSDTEACCSTILELNTDKTYQTIEGFGGAVTDSASMNWKSLPEKLQEYFIRSYFSEYGLEYNMLRVPIGGCDFSVRPYAYNELPINDTFLTNYTLAPEDMNYKIPMIKNIMQEATAPIHILATTWSPPVWMKTNNEYNGYSRLKPEYYQTYADYHLKFLEKYNESGIPVWGITTTNEPINGVFAIVPFNCLGWDVSEMGHWIMNNLGPTIRGSQFKDIKILTCDDQRATVPYWFNWLTTRYPDVLDYIDGIGVHFYTDAVVSPLVLNAVTKTHPDKFIIGTEACEGFLPSDTVKVLLGSWSRAKSYIHDIMEDLNYNLVGWIDWNLCLDLQGGPNWAKNFVDSPAIVDSANGEFIKQPMFYAMGHFSKFIPRGSVRIDVEEKKFILTKSVEHVAFITPKNTVVVVVYNDGGARTIYVKDGSKRATVYLEENSITTIELPW